MILDDPRSDAWAGNGEQTTAPAASVRAEDVLKSRVRSTELTARSAESGAWWWHGYVGAGKVTLLTSQWKSGKTTLMSILLARMSKGGEIAGLKVTAGSAAVFSEEPDSNWNERCRRLEIGGQHSFFCLPFAGRPTMEQWLGLIEAMLVLRRREHLDVVVIDPLGIFLPGNSENVATGITECLLPLRKLTAAGMGVVLVHHPRKGVNLAGQAARGSGALSSFVDILIEMHWYGKADEPDRRRWLRAYSRHQETRRNLILELTAAGDGYIAHDAANDDAWAASWQVLCLVLQDADERLTQRQILAQWPDDFVRPDQATISRGLKRGLEQGLILQRGTGRKRDPYRYWLPDKEDEFYPGPGASAEAMQRFQARHRAKLLEIIGMKPVDISAQPAPAPRLAPAEDGLAPMAVVDTPANVAAARESESVAPLPQRDQDRAPTPQPSTHPAAAEVALPNTPPEPAAGMSTAEVVSSPSTETAPVPVPIVLPVDIRVMRTPDPVLSDEEQKRRSRRWPYG